MYVCICNQIDEQMLADDPSLESVCGSCCGNCKEIPNSSNTDKEQQTDKLIVLGNGSKIRVVGSTCEKIKGTSPRGVVFQECAKVPDNEDI